MNGGPIERIVTHGVFELDGGSWEVDNNIWVVGDDSQVVGDPHPPDTPPGRYAGMPPNWAPCSPATPCSRAAPVPPAGPTPTSPPSSNPSRTGSASYPPTPSSTPATATPPPSATKSSTTTNGSSAATNVVRHPQTTVLGLSLLLSASRSLSRCTAANKPRRAGGAFSCRRTRIHVARSRGKQVALLRVSPIRPRYRRGACRS